MWMEARGQFLDLFSPSIRWVLRGLNSDSQVKCFYLLTHHASLFIGLFFFRTLHWRCTLFTVSVRYSIADLQALAGRADL